MVSLRDQPFPDPTILLHPQIPKPLHLVNPRTILGDAWWDDVRKEAYGRHDLRCHACGVSKYDAKYRQWLEAHEMYDIDYITGRVEFIEVVALCHYCHNYIHRGRLDRLHDDGRIEESLYRDIVFHGDSILKRAGLPLNANEQLQRLISKRACSWSDYHMIINGVRYERRFDTYDDWLNYWSGGGDSE